MNIDDYVDAALRAGRFSSERALSRFLGFGPGVINQYRTKRTWPSDDTMIRLADLAGADPEQALIDLNLWRSQSSRVRAVYSKIAEKLQIFSRSAAQVLVLVGVLYSSSSGNALATNQPSVSPSIHYAISRRRPRLILAPV